MRARERPLCVACWQALRWARGLCARRRRRCGECWGGGAAVHGARRDRSGSRAGGTGSAAERLSETMGERSGVGVVASVSSMLTALRDTPAFPDDAERRRVLVMFLEFAAAEASPNLFEAVAAEMLVGGLEMPEDNALLKAYSVYDHLHRSGGDGEVLESGVEAFSAELVNYRGATVPALDDVKQQLQCELRAQVCLGKLLPGARDEAVFEGEPRALKQFEAAVHRWFPEEEVGAAGIARSKSPAAVAHEMAVREELQRVVDLTRAAAPKKGRKGEAELKKAEAAVKKAEAAVEQAVQNHSWAAFHHAVRLYLSVLLYEAHGGPVALGRVRGAQPPPAPAPALGLAAAGARPSKASPAHRARPAKPHKPSSKLMQLKLAMARAGKAEEWRALTNASDEAGRVLLKQVLDRADDFAEQRAQLLEDETIKRALAYPDEVVYSQPLAPEQPPKAAGDGSEQQELEEDGLEEEEGEEEEDDDDEVRGARAAKRAKTADDRDAKRALEQDPAYKALVGELDKKIGDNRSVAVGPAQRKPRKQAVPWTVEETEALQRGVELFGVGSWARIVTAFPTVFAVNERNGPALKDRYRNLEAIRNRAENSV